MYDTNANAKLFCTKNVSYIFLIIQKKVIIPLQYYNEKTIYNKYKHLLSLIITLKKRKDSLFNSIPVRGSQSQSL